MSKRVEILEAQLSNGFAKVVDTMGKLEGKINSTKQSADRKVVNLASEVLERTDMLLDNTKSNRDGIVDEADRIDALMRFLKIEYVVSETDTGSGGIINKTEMRKIK